MMPVTFCAPVNISVIKYWGKQNEDLIIPMNSSIGLTLDQTQLCAKTTVVRNISLADDKIWLNGKEESIDNPRIQNVLKEIRRLSRKRHSSSGEAPSVGQKVHICSENNFPTAAGLASSAAGYACLVHTLAKAFSVKGNLSRIARQGSGSACRSTFGGFVQWSKGHENDGSDCVAEQLFPEDHWPQLRVLIAVVNEGKKGTGSTSGMQRSVQTSSLIKHRADVCVPDRIIDMQDAIRRRDFSRFAEITMKESNQIHAVCMDTYPPVLYLNDTSRALITIVHDYNSYHGENRAAYTFDAGPNAFLFLENNDVPEFLGLLRHHFPSNTQSDDVIHGIATESTKPSKALLDHITIPILRDEIKYVISTKVGPGPQQLLDASHHLLDDQGIPFENRSK